MSYSDDQSPLDRALALIGRNPSHGQLVEIVGTLLDVIVEHVEAIDGAASRLDLRLRQHDAATARRLDERTAALDRRLDHLTELIGVAGSVLREHDERLGRLDGRQT